LVLPPRTASEPLTFLLALHAAQRSITLLHARTDPAGRELVRSSFADEAARALRDLGVREVTSTALQPIPALTSCATAEELLARAALEAFAEPAWRVSRPLPAEDARALAARVLPSPLRPRLLRVARASLAERERLRAFVGDIEPGRFSGQLSGRALALAAPLFRFDAVSPASASRLEDAAHCKFRLFGKRVLGLEEDDEALDDLAAHQRGTLLHGILESVYQRLRERDLLPLQRKDTGEILALLEAISIEQCEAFARTQPVGHRGLWSIRRQEVAQTAREVVLHDLAAGADPLELERKFGPDADWPPVLLPSPGGEESLVVRGAIDRVDRRPALEGRRSLLVLDYKSRSIEGLREQLRPARWTEPDFQLLVYALALRAKHPDVIVDAALYSLKSAEQTLGLREAASKKKPPVDLAAILELDPAARARLRQSEPEVRNVADAAWELASALRAGTMPVQPLGCDWCQLKPVCRIVALPEGEEDT
ncbi:MAG: PD-(D/E)XK nuclease family protein, partial [Deltaproteobacteria bacterium]|nr:PD-(D/E)XK nuclease family protein [Deltaproteobacteria bacterium]